MFRPNTFQYLFILSGSSRGKPKCRLGRISPNKSYYNRNGLWMIYNAYCAPVLLFLSGMAHLFRKTNLHTLCAAYFRYCKFLLWLPRWHQNRKIIARFGLIDMPSWIWSSSDDLCKKNYLLYSRLRPSAAFFPYWYWLISPCCRSLVWFFFLAVDRFCLFIILLTLGFSYFYG